MSLLPFLDVTCLEEQVTQSELSELCQQVRQASVTPAAICVYPQHLPFVKSQLADLPIGFATVINFPHGMGSIDAVKAEIDFALSVGATELDIVMPYEAFLDDQELSDVQVFVESCKHHINERSLFKLILETGEIEDRVAIYELSLIACEGGVDFIKTSTGKVEVGATLEATGAILQAIKNYNERPVGLKISGGVRTPEQANAFYEQVEAKLGKTWLTPQLFRIGASQLFKAIAG